MRETKYRAWQKHNKFMAKVVEIRFVGGERIQMTASLEYRPGDIRQLFVPQECELMQYTGLTDKNGKEIYEGDIIKVDDSAELIYEASGVVAPIIFGRGAFRFKCFEDFEKVLDESDCIEIIGNIYENPELLEKPK